MKYLALDQSLKVSGWAIFYNTRIKKVGTFSTNPTHSLDIRLNTIWQHLNILYEQENFEYVFFEDVQKQVNVETFKRLCYVQAVVMLWCKQHKIEYMILSPSHGRKIMKDQYLINFGRKREEQKRAAQEGVHQNFADFQDATEDECDAICLGAAGINELDKNRSAF